MMSTYTIQLGTIVAQPTQDRNDLTFDQKLEVGRKHLFDFDYPFFDDRYRDEFERKFIMNFYDREIGYETEFLFKMRLKNWLMINMPYFNQLFESELIKFDPLINSETKVKHELNKDGTSESDKTHDDTHTKNILDEKDTTENIKKQTDKDVDGDYSKDKDRTLDGTYDSEGNRVVDGIYDSEGNRVVDGIYDSEGNRLVDGIYDSEGNRLVDGIYDSDGNRVVDGIYDSDGNRVLDHQYDGNINRTMDGEVNSNTDIDSQSNETSNTDESGNRTTEEDRFNRDLKTDTPDTRLSITANRGESGTGYASEIGEKMQDDSITENTSSESSTTTNTNADSSEITEGTTFEEENMSDDRTSNDTETTSENRTTKDTETTSENRTTKDTETTSENRTTKDTESTSENRTTKDTENTTENRTTKDTESTTENRTTKDIEGTQESGQHSETTNTVEETDRTQHELREVGEDGRRDINELINGKTTDKELFDQHRIGKIGIQTYSKMLTEFRSTFLRIERDCFREMNQLFMLVY